MNLRNLKIGTLLGIGVAGIIFVLVSGTLYLNYLSNNAQTIIISSTNRIFDVLTIQRDTEGLISALENFIFANDQSQVDAGEKQIKELFVQAEETLTKSSEKEVFLEKEEAELKAALANLYSISQRIFILKEDLVNQGIVYSGLYYGSDSSQEAGDLSNEFINMRNAKYPVFEVVHDIIIRSDEEFRGASSLLWKSQIISWAVAAISLASALVLAFFLVKYIKKTFDLKNEFINIIAHDLRNPVTAIIGFLDIIKTSKNSSKKELDEYVGIIHASALKLRNQINNLLEVGRSEAGVLKVSLEPVNVSEALKESSRRASAIAQAMNMKIIYKARPNLPMVIAEKNKITDVIDNLISNALKYNRENGTVTIKAESTGTRVIISVVDTGYGIPESDKNKIFKKYSRLGGKSEKKRGTGLGLYTAKMLVEKMGGTISFVSEEGKGTTFSISLKTKGG